MISAENELRNGTYFNNEIEEKEQMQVQTYKLQDFRDYDVQSNTW